MPIEVRDNIYSDIANQFPNVYKENSEFLLAFVEAYYEHLDEKLDRDIPKLKDIDTTLNTFLIFYKRKYLSELPFSDDVDIRFILKHIQDLYTRKGSEESLQLLFKMFFNEDIEIMYPGNNVFKPSDSLWGGETFLEMKPVYNVEGYPIQRGNTIRGDLSDANAFVDDIVFVNLAGAITPIVYLSNLRGTFTRSDALEVLTATNDGIETITNVGKLIQGSISGISVIKRLRLPSNKVGDTVDIVSTKVGQGAKGVVTKINTDQIGSIDYEIVDGGWGYIDPTSITIEYFNDIGVSNRVIIVDQNTTLNVTPGDTIIFPGSTIDYDGRSDNSIAYSLTGAARVVAYRHPLLFIETRSDLQEIYDFMSQYYNTGNIDNNGESIYRNVLFDHFYNGYYQALTAAATGGTSGQRQFNVDPDYDDILTYIYYKPDDTSDSIVGNFTGDQQVGDLTTIDDKIQLQDFLLFFRFQQAVNNGINDSELFSGVTDFDTIISTAGDITQIGVTDVDGLAVDTPDRIPTIASVQPGPGFDSVSSAFIRTLEQLDNGQMYTIVNPGTVLTEEDWTKIGATKSTIGHDFQFTSANLASLTVTDLTGHDAIFSSAKQVMARLYQYLTYNTVQKADGSIDQLLPALSIGETFELPPNIPETVSEAYPATGSDGNPIAVGQPHPNAGQPDWQWYDAYFVPANQLIAGREYMPFTFGNLTYAEWKSVGLNLDGSHFELVARSSNSSTLKPRRTYIIKDLGDTGSGDWNLMGASTAPAVGDKFQASLVQPSFPATTITFTDAAISGANISSTAHGFRDQDKVVFGQGSGTLTLAAGGTLANASVLYVKVINADVINVYTSNTLDGTALVTFGSNSGATGHSLTKQLGTPKVIDVRKAFDTGAVFTATTPQPTGITANALCVDKKKVGVGASNQTPITFGGQTVQVELGFFNTGGIMTDPLKDTSNKRVDKIPDAIANESNIKFMGLINGDFSQPVHCTHIGSFNDTTSFEISAIDEEETVTLVPDIIGDVVLDRLFLNQYTLAETAFDDNAETITLTNDIDHGFTTNTDVVFTQESGAGSISGLTSGTTYKAIRVDANKIQLKATINGSAINFTVSGTGVYKISEAGVAGDSFKDGLFTLSGQGIESLSTEYRDAFTRITFTLGRISELREDNPGTEYENDVGVRVVNDVVARFNKKDLVVRFDDADFNLRENEIVTQEIVLDANLIDQVNGLSEATINGMASGYNTTAFVLTDVTDGSVIPISIPYGTSNTTFEIVTEKYTSKAKFVKRVDEDFYFRPITFYTFDKNVPINIRAKDRNMTDIGRDESSLPMGANAIIAGPANYDSGQIDELEVTHTGYKFDDNELVNIVNTNPDSIRYNKVVCTADLRTLGQGNTSGKWKTRNSFVGEYSTRIHDNDYYQEYSYDISSMIDPVVYSPLVKNVVGVAGTKMFSTPLINSDNAMQSNVDVEIQRFTINVEDLIAQGTGDANNAALNLDDPQQVLQTEGGEDYKVVTVSESTE